MPLIPMIIDQLGWDVQRIYKTITTNSYSASPYSRSARTTEIASQTIPVIIVTTTIVNTTSTTNTTKRRCYHPTTTTTTNKRYITAGNITTTEDGEQVESLACRTIRFSAFRTSIRSVFKFRWSWIYL